MKHILRVIKRKRNLRRLSAVWLLLIAIELLVPAFGDQHVFAEVDPSEPKTTFSADAKNYYDTKFDDTSISASGDQTQNNPTTTVCHDECLCHASAIPNLVAPNLKRPSFARERIPDIFADPIYSSLPPPFHPPKLS